MPELVQDPQRERGSRSVIRTGIRPTAAPYFFAPEEIEIVGKPRRVSGLFIDGGVTPHNNPAFQLYLLATLPGHGFDWPTGDDKILVTSVGTGSLVNDTNTARLKKLPSALAAKEALTSMISGAEDMGEMLMQLISEPEDPDLIDSELGYLKGVLLTNEARCSYQRFQTRLIADVLRQDLGLALTTKQIDTVRNMTDSDGLQIAYEIGQAIADRKVKESHFPAVFDLPPAHNPHGPEDEEPPAQMPLPPVAASMSRTKVMQKIKALAPSARR